jgi:pyruvate dehydrogenase E2 component (dihydrolipoamide acetyltransferase)
MAAEMTMPSLGMTMEEGRVVTWRVKEGDVVARGQVLVDIESEKTAFEMESPAAGVVGRILVLDDTVVPVGTKLCNILSEEDTGEILADEDSREAPEPATQAPAVAPAAAPNKARSRASPRARKLAETLGVDIASLTASSPDGMISESDVRAAAQATPAAPTAAEAGLDTAFTLRPLTSMRRAIAERMAESVRSAAHFFLAVEVDGSALLACRAARAPRLAAETGVKLTLTDLLVVITARTLVRHRALNASFTADGIREWNTVDLGIAVALDDGLIVPVIRAAERKSLAEIVPVRADLVARAQAGKLARHEVESGSFTLSNLGALGVDFFTSILNPPQAGILSVGAIAERPAAVNGAVVVRPSMIVGLTIDHRVTDGAAGARFLADLRARIETATLEE